MTEFVLILFVIVGAVTSYAIGYFRERLVIEPDEKDPELPSGADEAMRHLYNTYSEEVRVKYLRNHNRRRSEKFFKEFTLVSFQFVVFCLITLGCAKIEAFAPALTAAEILVGLIFMTMGLKAGQLTASKETTDHKEKYLIHYTELVNAARKNMLENCPPEKWEAAMSIRDEKTPLHY